MTAIVFLDANVLVPYNLMSILLTMAEDGLFTPRWSQAVLNETSRALVEKLGLPRDDVTRRIQAMTEAFPEAMVTGYEHLEATVNCDPQDRHVLAAAVAAGADALVTVNLRDFPTDEMDRLEIDVLHPEQFLFQVWSLDIDAVRAALLRDATRRVRPPTSLRDREARSGGPHVRERRAPVGRGAASGHQRRSAAGGRRRRVNPRRWPGRP